MSILSDVALNRGHVCRTHCCNSSADVFEAPSGGIRQKAPRVSNAYDNSRRKAFHLTLNSMLHMLHSIEEFLKPYGNTISFVVGLAGILVGWFFYLCSKRDSFASGKLLAEQTRIDGLRHAENQEEMRRLLSELAAIHKASAEDQKVRNDAALADLETRFAPKVVKAARRALLRGKTEEAEGLFKRILEEEPEFSSNAAYQLGALAENRFDFVAARGYYAQAASVAPDEPRYLVAAGRLALVFDDFSDADGLLGRALRLLPAEKDIPSVELGTALFGLGRVRHEQRRWAEAEDYHKRALATREKVLGKEHPDTARSLHGLGEVCYGQGRYAEAEDYYQRALAIREKVLGKEHPETAWSLHGLGAVCHWQGRYAEAEEYAQRALAIREKVLGKEHRETAWSLQALGAICFGQGRYAEAEDYAQQALAILEKVLGKEHPDTAWSLHSLGGACNRQGRHAEAEDYSQQALAILERVLGKEHPDTAWSLHSLGGACHGQGRYAEAENYAHQALAIREKVLGREHPDTAWSLHNLGAAFGVQGRYAEAENYYRRALAVREKVLGKEHSDTICSLQGLGAAYGMQGRYAEAERYLWRALSIEERVVGEKHPETIKTIFTLATLFDRRNLTNQADTLYNRALSRIQKSRPETSELRRTILADYAGLLERTGSSRAAELWSELKETEGLRAEAASQPAARPADGK